METPDIGDQHERQRKRKSRPPEPSPPAPKRPSLHPHSEPASLAAKSDSEPASVEPVVEYVYIRGVRHRKTTKEEIDALRRKWMAESEAENERRLAEEERRRGLSPTERLKEDGQTLLRDLGQLKKTIVLQPTPLSYRGGAGCRAGDDCFQRLAVEMICREMMRENSNLQYSDGYRKRGNIRDDYRIFVDGGHFDKKYYHVKCFETMVDLEPLIPDTFFLDLNRGKDSPFPPSWGLMFRHWFRNKGNIDLDKIAAYIDAEKAYQSIPGDSQSQPPTERPVLRGYVTAAGGGCSLSDVVQHRCCDSMPQSWIAMYGSSGLEWKMMVPENEAQAAADLEVRGVESEKGVDHTEADLGGVNGGEGVDGATRGEEERTSDAVVRGEGEGAQE